MEESGHGSVGLFGQKEQEVGDLCRHMIQILSGCSSVGRCNFATQDGKGIFIDLIVAEITKGLGERAALHANGGHVPRGGLLEVSSPPADLDLTGRPVGEEDDAGGVMLESRQHVDSVGAGRLEADAIPNDQRTGDVTGGKNRPRWLLAVWLQSDVHSIGDKAEAQR